MQEQFIKHHLGETHLLQWGDKHAPPLLLVHGLGGQAANYLDLAEYLAKSYRVLALDLPGRGLSTWAANPQQEYCFEHYQAVILEVLSALRLQEKLRWIGTSMGGALGFQMAAGALSGKVTHLLVNDIGPELPEQVAKTIAEGTGQLPVADTLEKLAVKLGQSFAAMANVERPLAYWMARARYFARRREDGRYTLHYDPRVAGQLVYHPQDFEQWDAFTTIDIPLMVIRGELSEVLSKDLFERMQQQKPTMVCRVVPGCGHAPLLEDRETLDVIGRFLKSGAENKGVGHD